MTCLPRPGHVAEDPRGIGGIENEAVYLGVICRSDDHTTALDVRWLEAAGNMFLDCPGRE